MTFDAAACLLAIRRSTPSCCEWECAIVTEFGYGPPPRRAPGALQEFDKSCQTSPSAAEMVWNLLDWTEATQHCPTHRETCGPRAPVHCRFHSFFTFDNGVRLAGPPGTSSVPPCKFEDMFDRIDSGNNMVVLVITW